MPSSNIKPAIARVLKEEGYIDDFSVPLRRQDRADGQPQVLRGRAGDRRLERVSRPGLRIYAARTESTKVLAAWVSP